MTDTYFAELLPALRTRAARATVSRLGFSCPPLRQHLLDVFSSGYGQPGSFLGEPIFEATFGWRQAEPTFGHLARSLLHPSLVDALEAPGGENSEDYRFPRDGHPYTHQMMSWETLLSPTPQSVVVTSGTGSGKTECFMVPVLSRLAAERANNPDMPLRGVRALFLYPLNALIQSQRERLRAWTAPFGDGLRFCLYNGNTPDQAKAEEQRKAPNEVLDRATLRRSPPPILVTNPTMLEYMLVRAQDAPILKQSQGMLEWIVLDEAHNYIGSQAAELALLLRRVLHAFGTSAGRVRFVATSATISGSDDQARQDLKRFLADLAGVDESRVTVVEGTRQVPDLTRVVDESLAQQGPQELGVPDTADRYQRLSAHPLARRLRSLFVPASSGSGWQPLRVVRDELRQAGRPYEEPDALAWLDLLTSAKTGRGRQTVPFLPLRLHAFHNTLDGLWACADATCLHRVGTALDHADWPYGVVHMEERQHCGCGSPVYPLVSCTDCSETFLEANLRQDDGGVRLVAPADKEDVDEFKLDQDQESDTTAEVEDADAEAGGAHLGEMNPYTSSTPVLLVRPGYGAPIIFHRRTLDLIFDSAKSSDMDARQIHLHEESQDGNEQMILRCPCCAGYENRPEQFRRARLGAPFLLGSVIPTLLEFCPDGDDPLDRPMRGRRMITFTDSRQGTARIATRMQQDAERTALRAGVYLRLAQESAGSSAERIAIEQRVKDFRGLLKRMPNDPTIEKMLHEESEKLQQLSNGKAVDWREMKRWLATQSPDVSRWISSYYGGVDPKFKGDQGREDLAEILLCREFAHRPKRANSLESLGLVSVQYPRLRQVVTLPPAVQAEGLSLEEWRDFLKLCLDFFVRDRWCLQMPPGWLRWGAQRTWVKKILPPNSREKGSPKLIRWPQVSRRVVHPSLVRVLARVLRLDVQANQSISRIDSVLLAAWDDLVHVGLLLSDGMAYNLSLQDIALRHITRGWLCPVTNRVLDTTLRGVTPYLPPQPQSDSQVLCNLVELPVCTTLTQPHSDAASRLSATRAWIQAQPEIAQARAMGLWSDISDRVLEGAGYFRAVEHSAQQSSELLKLYEREFREGRINLMSCSTTMEMGVDIGGINMVAMNNVPPHPANYLQRAGRAGRRAETRSVALTVCKNNPHDQHVFAHTDWPFTTPMRTPGISLSSAVLVRRHVNALLLSRFLRLQSGDGPLDKLTMDWWMLTVGGATESARQDRFVAWCEAFDAKNEAGTAEGLIALVRNTALQGVGPRALAGETAAHAARHARAWRDELKALDDQLSNLSAKDEADSLPRRAIEIQRKRLIGEYLLREMASGGFLPGYGFPTDITSFETLNVEAIKSIREKKEGREDNRFQRRELPSRDTVTALREYAPGASVVIDGLVYESAGITLNWHVPASVEAAHELQNIRHAWRCRHCGANGTHVKRPTQCPECGRGLGQRQEAFRNYLEPAGFSVDLHELTHNDITQQRYVAPEPPWIAGHGDWLPLPNPALGRFRSSAEGSVFHHSSGPNGHGYAVCLECGRAAPMGSSSSNDPTLPAVFSKPHYRLRGRRGKDKADMCGSSEQSFKIKPGLHFGREYTTDVLEVALYGLDGLPLKQPVAAFTLVVALRRAIARWLGIDEGELGCDIKALRDESGQSGQILQIFDMRSAGYSSLVAQCLPKLLSDMRRQLLCERECKGACQHCLLSYGTRFRVDELDRQKALEFLTPEWISALALPPELEIFGPESRAEVQLLEESLLRELNRTGACRLELYLHGDAGDWDLAVSPMKTLLHRLSVKAQESEATLCLVLPTADFSMLEASDAAVLRSLQQVCSVDIQIGSAPPLCREGRGLATIQRNDGHWRSWGTVQIDLAQPNASWGQSGSQPLVVSPWRTDPLPTRAVQTVRLPEPTHTASGGWTVEIGRDIDGKGSGFGHRFWAALGRGDITSVLPSGRCVTSVMYEDRYLHNPVACALLVEVVSALKAYYEPRSAWDVPPVCVRTMSIESKPIRHRGSAWTSDWADDALRDQVLREAFSYAGIDAQVISLPKNATRHARLLVVDFDDKTRLRVMLDQGLSYWTVEKNSMGRYEGFLPNSDLKSFGEALGEIRVDLRGHETPTMVVVEPRCMVG